jgi:Na+/melibiose symporter-like transporter
MLGYVLLKSYLNRQSVFLGFLFFLGFSFFLFFLFCMRNIPTKNKNPGPNCGIEKRNHRQKRPKEKTREFRLDFNNKTLRIFYFVSWLSFQSGGAVERFRFSDAEGMKNEK